MRTRTLIILATVCGSLILVAGVIQLLRIAATDEPGDSILGVAQSAELGALSARVTGADDTGESMVVTVELAFDDDGVTSLDDSTDADDHFRLLAGELRPPTDGDGGDGGGDGACASLTVSAQTCTLTFALTDAPGGSRVLLLDWDGETARWDVA